jgi:four helix bundle protein
MTAPEELGKRTQRFALSIVRLYSKLPKREEAYVLGKQLLRSGTSVGAHFYESQRARSRAEFLSKLEVGLQELQESKYWLQLLIDAEIIEEENNKPLLQEMEELMAIFASITKKLKIER